MSLRKTVKAAIAAGIPITPENLPTILATKRGLSTSSKSLLNRVVSDIDELEGGDSDTQGFYFNDENIFESGGLNKSDHKKVLKSPLVPMVQNASKAIYNPSIPSIIRPGDSVTIQGDEYEFVGYLGSEMPYLTDHEINSFQGEGEFSEFGFLKKIGKKIKKGVVTLAKKKLGKIVTGVAGRLVPGAGVAIAAASLLRKRRKTSRFDGLQEYEYFIGPANFETSDLFGIKLKKVGKALKKATKAVGKGLKAAGKATLKAAKFTSKVLAPKQAAAISQGENEGMAPAAWSQQQAAMDIANGDGGLSNNMMQNYDEPGTYEGSYGPEYGINPTLYDPKDPVPGPPPLLKMPTYKIVLMTIAALCTIGVIYIQLKKKK